MKYICYFYHIDLLDNNDIFRTYHSSFKHTWYLTKEIPLKAMSLNFEADISFVFSHMSVNKVTYHFDTKSFIQAGAFRSLPGRGAVTGTTSGEAVVGTASWGSTQVGVDTVG